ncbi:Transcription initiation factor tfiid [Entamoeba marina]
MKGLSSKNGRIHLVEYIEQYPPLLSQIGMGARIRNYFKRENEEEISEISTGEMVIVEREEESPFLGKIKTGTSIQSFDNKMTKTPIHECEMKSTDFLLIRSVDGKTWNVREIDHLFVGGQQQPQKDTEIPVPGSKAEISFHKDRLETTIYLSLHKNPIISIADIISQFPNQTKSMTRKILRNYFDLPSEEDLFAKMTPERICCFEAMNAGKMRLQDRGISLFKYGQLVSAKQNFDPNLKKRVELLIEEVRCLPGTSMNILAKEMKGISPLDYRIKDTSSRHLIEYYRIHVSKQIDAGKLNIEIKEKYGDMRKLTIQQLRTRLKECGVTDDNILKRPRCELVKLLSKEVSKSVGISTEKSVSQETNRQTPLKQIKRKILPLNETLQEQHKKRENINSKEKQRSLTRSFVDTNESNSMHNIDFSSPNSSQQKDSIITDVNVFSSGSPRISYHLINDEINLTEKKDTKEVIRVKPTTKKSTRQEKSFKRKISITEQLNHSTGKINPTSSSPRTSIHKSKAQEKSKLKVLLESCMEHLKQSQCHEYFKYFFSIDIHTIHDYSKYVQNLIGLGVIEKKIRKDEYHKVNDFFKDVERVVDNCIKYNSRGIFKDPTLISKGNFLYECTTSFISKIQRNL